MRHPDLHLYQLFTEKVFSLAFNCSVKRKLDRPLRGAELTQVVSSDKQDDYADSSVLYLSKNNPEMGLECCNNIKWNKFLFLRPKASALTILTNRCFVETRNKWLGKIFFWHRCWAHQHTMRREKKTDWINKNNLTEKVWPSATMHQRSWQNVYNYLRRLKCHK